MRYERQVKNSLSQPPVYVGIDLGHTVGYAYYVDGSYQAYGQWELFSPTANPLMLIGARRRIGHQSTAVIRKEKVSEFAHKLRALSNSYSPDRLHVWYELPFSRSIDAAMILYALEGALMSWAAGLNIELNYITPQQIRKILTGKMSGKKAKLREVAEQLSGRHFLAREQHEADAICIVAAGMGKR